MTDITDLREINKRIAEFMGWCELEWREAGRKGRVSWPGGWWGRHPSGSTYLTFDYAHSMDNLAPVIEKLRKDSRFISVAVVGEQSFAADVYDKGNGWLATATAETMAMAVCMAIIDYLEGEDGVG